MTRTSFVVERRRWAKRGNGPARASWRRVAASDVVATFATRDAADAEARRLEAKARDGCDPFLLGGPALWYQTSLDAGRLHDWLLDHDVPLPAVPMATHGQWRAWWRTASRELSDAHRAAVWGALDKCRFHDVTERGAAAFGVQIVTWKRLMPTGYSVPADPEGGLVQDIYRTRAGAEASCATLDDVLREEERASLEAGYETDTTFDVTRPGHPKIRDAGIDDVPFADVTEVPAFGPVGSPAWMLWRPSYDADGGPCRDGTGVATQADVALAVYATQDDARTEAAHRTAAARQGINPFAIPQPFGDLAALTARGYDELRAAIAKLGLTPPTWASGAKHWPAMNKNDFWPPAWVAWWDAAVDRMSDAQRDGVWGLLERLELFSVTEVPVLG